MIKVDFGEVLPIVQYVASDSGQTILEFIYMPQISDGLMHPGHKRAPNLRQTYAPRA